MQLVRLLLYPLVSVVTLFPGKTSFSLGLWLRLVLVWVLQWACCHTWALMWFPLKSYGNYSQISKGLAEVGSLVRQYYPCWISKREWTYKGASVPTVENMFFNSVSQVINVHCPARLMGRQICSQTTVEWCWSLFIGLLQDL